MKSNRANRSLLICPHLLEQSLRIYALRLCKHRATIEAFDAFCEVKDRSSTSWDWPAASGVIEIA